MKTATNEIQTRLLVSVRNAVEAQAALQGGCDIVDVKEPSRGSLGMAPLDAIADVIQTVSQTSHEMPVSAALGETSDWSTSDNIPTLPQPLSYVKLGLANLGTGDGWITQWQAVRRQFDETSDGPLKWIAVVYADWQRAQAPSPDAVIDAAMFATARDEACAGILFDTFVKDGRGLLDWISRNQLVEFVARIRLHGLMVAFAGGLRASQLELLRAAQPDIIAIRTAGCRNANRSGEIATDAVRTVKNAIDIAFAPAIHP